MIVMPTSIDSTAAPAHPDICDIVMKGGITSGVVYPGAIVTLSKRYSTFHSVGGSSAGAIAAAMTAAAEFQRRHSGSDAGFVQLGQLPMQLGAKDPSNSRSRLFNLFQPQPKLKRLWSALGGAVGGGSAIAVLSRLLFSSLKAYPVAVLSLLPATLLLLASPASPTVLGLIVQISGALVLLALSLIVGTLAVVAAAAWRELPANGWGICSGATIDPAAGAGLVAWLNDRIQTAAALPNAQPLTFGLLQKAPLSPAQRALHVPPSRAIDLRVTTSCLTWQQLLSIPSDAGDWQSLYFNVAEFRAIFPPEVVDHLIRHSPDEGRDKAHLRLPPNEHLPVIIAVRMSLSFPILLSAIRLYARDFSRRGATEGNDPAAQKMLRPVWFTDGGVCSNLPVHFFDSPVPSHPTYAINLSEPHPDRALRPKIFEDTWITSNAQRGRGPTWTRFDDGRGATVSAFLMALVDTARNWPDRAQMRLTGYRERIGHVVVDANEGGLNLDMPPEIIRALSERGAKVSNDLHAHFADPAAYKNASGWQRHQWKRVQVWLDALAEMRADVERGCLQAGISLQDLKAMIDAAPGSEKVPGEQRVAYSHLLDALAAIHPDQIKTLLDDKANGSGTDRPKLVLRARS
jgi:predicted acylesterase/phospholipase RssA